MWPYTSGQYMTLDAHHNILMPPCTVTAHVPEVDGAETIGTKAADLEAVVHVSDRNMIGINISSQIFEWGRLEHPS